MRWLGGYALGERLRSGLDALGRDDDIVLVAQAKGLGYYFQHFRSFQIELDHLQQHAWGRYQWFAAVAGRGFSR